MQDDPILCRRLAEQFREASDEKAGQEHFTAALILNNIARVYDRRAELASRAVPL